MSTDPRAGSTSAFRSSFLTGESPPQNGQGAHNVTAPRNQPPGPGSRPTRSRSPLPTAQQACCSSHYSEVIAGPASTAARPGSRKRPVRLVRGGSVCGVLLKGASCCEGMMTEVEVPILQPMAARNRALRPCSIAVGSAARARSTRPQDERTFRNTYVARRAPGPDGDSIGVWCRALERDGVVPSSAARLRHDRPRPGKVRYCLASRRRRGGQSPNTSDDHQDTEHPPTERIGAERPGHKTCNPPRDHSPHPSRRPATGWPQRPAESAVRRCGPPDDSHNEVRKQIRASARLLVEPPGLE